MIILSVAGDYLIKKSSLLGGVFGWKHLAAGCMVYGISAVGWFWVYRYAKIFTVGAFYSLGVIAVSIILSLVVFKEKINSWEIFGLVLGTVACVILLKNGTA